MYFTKFFFMVVALMVASNVESHMIMNHPNPFPEGLNNSPLVWDGSDFPCKQRGEATYKMTDELLQSNTYAVGSNTTLSFKGSATHGGGSCQISLTTDLEPTKNSKWFVIHSIEGGCPIKSDGNQGNNADSTDSSTIFQFTIPNIHAGRYTLAWTWFNRIGNREMYMNCAPIQITSGSSHKRDEEAISKRDDQYPEMFVANINGCNTTENFDIRFPNPGNSVEYAGDPANLHSPACTGGSGPTATGFLPAAVPTATGAGTGSGSPSGGSPGGSSGGSPGGSSGHTSAVTTAAAHPTDAPGQFHEKPTTTAAVATSAPGASTSGSSSASSNAGALHGPCTPEGQWNCIGGTSFQRCASGSWSAVLPVAAGTGCKPGQSADFNVFVTKRELDIAMHRRRLSPGGHVHV